MSDPRILVENLINAPGHGHPIGCIYGLMAWSGPPVALEQESTSEIIPQP